MGLELRDARLARRSFERRARHARGLGRRASSSGCSTRRRAAAPPRCAQLERAARLNRNDPIVTEAIAAVEKGERLDPLDVNRQVLEQPLLAAPP